MKPPWVYLYLSRLFDDTKNIARGFWFGRFQCDKIKQMTTFLNSKISQKKKTKTKAINHIRHNLNWMYIDFIK
jgi:hypothetical protein